jgi:acetyl-CoA carboxylase carboxyl transferase subunit alpha
MRSPDKKEKFSEELKLTAPELKKLGIIDSILKEPLGGAQNDPQAVATGLKKEIVNALSELKGLSSAELVQKRIGKFRNMGHWLEKR